MSDDPDNPNLTVEDIKEIMSYDPESEVDRLCFKVDALELERDAMREALEMARVSLEACHARTIHGEVVTREECHLCKVLGVINHLLPPTK